MATGTKDVLEVNIGRDSTKGIVGTTFLEEECLDSCAAKFCFCSTDGLGTQACLVPCS